MKTGFSIIAAGAAMLLVPCGFAGSGGGPQEAAPAKQAAAPTGDAPAPAFRETDAAAPASAAPVSTAAASAATVPAGGGAASAEPGSLPGSTPLPGEKRAGGPCEYNEYPGTATITKILRTDRSRKQASLEIGAGYRGCEVWFTFQPAVIINEEWARKAAEREQLFQLMNSWYPGPKYLTKYGIEPDKTFPCVYKVITKGTCTPALFDFPGIKRDDYFESQPEQ